MKSFRRMPAPGLKSEISAINTIPFRSRFFSNLNITVEPGESVALVGPSGVGKTTLLKVMCGLLSPTSGDVFADNLDIQKIGLNNYRRGTACVLQEDRLFSGSLIDNISGFEDNADVDFCRRMRQTLQHSRRNYEKCRWAMKPSLVSWARGFPGAKSNVFLIARALYRKTEHSVYG